MKGGKRQGAGRPKGSLNQSTIEKKKAEEMLTDRILKNVDRLFNAQLSLAEGNTYLYKIIETGSGKTAKREHVLVTNPDEIKQFLDEHEGGSGTVDDNYYYLTTKTPDNKAIDSMLDRVFGKAISKTEHTGKHGEPIQFTWQQSPSPTSPASGLNPSTTHLSAG